MCLIVGFLAMEFLRHAHYYIRLNKLSDICTINDLRDWFEKYETVGMHEIIESSAPVSILNKYKRAKLLLIHTEVDANTNLSERLRKTIYNNMAQEIKKPELDITTLAEIHKQLGYLNLAEQSNKNEIELKINN
jgi:hypothetical protein